MLAFLRQNRCLELFRTVNIKGSGIDNNYVCLRDLPRPAGCKPYAFAVDTMHTFTMLLMT